LGRWIDPQVDLAPDERARLARLEHEAAERRYRIRSDVYDHDLAKLFDGPGWWGPLRYHVVTNSLGFKDASRRVVPLHTERRRVLLLGDSFTEGIGLDFGDSYAGLIAKELATRGVEVLNTAVTSYSPAIYYAKTRFLLEDVGLHCTEVVVFIDISDAEDEARYYDLHTDGRVTRMVDQQPGRGPDIDDGVGADDETALDTLSAIGITSQNIETKAPPRINDTQERVPSRLSLTVAHYSLFARAWQILMRPSSPVAYPQANPRRGLWTVDERDYEAYGRMGLERGARHMDRLFKLLQHHRIGLTLAVYPWPDQLRYDRPDSIQVRFWRDWAQHRRVPFIDLFAPFFGERDRNATIRQNYVAGDIHFNKSGSKWMASSFLTQFILNGSS
jgi:hypothetical protein